MSDNAYRAKKIADLNMVVHNSHATRAELRWAACEALAILERAHGRLKIAGPLVDAVEAIAREIASEQSA